MNAGEEPRGTGRDGWARGVWLCLVVPHARSRSTISGGFHESNSVELMWTNCNAHRRVKLRRKFASKLRVAGAVVDGPQTRQGGAAVYLGVHFAENATARRTRWLR